MAVKSKFKIKHFINYFLTLALLLAVFIPDILGVATRTHVNMMTEISIYIVLAVSLNLVVGFLGELSLGHAGFMCTGAYIGGYIVKLMVEKEQSFYLAIVVALIAGGLAAAILGFLIGLPTLRLKGDYLAIVTLAFGEIIRNLFKNMPETVFGGSKGLDSIRWKDSKLYIIGFIAVFAVVFVAQNLKRSKHGRAIQAIRDNEIAARACGVNVTYYKLAVFVIAAFFAGIAGVLYAEYTTPVRYSDFSFNKSIEVLVMVVLGGMGNITGSIISAALITFINNKLTDILTGSAAAYKYLLYALILILMVIWNNAPALKNVREKYSPMAALRKRFTKKKVDQDSEISVNADWDKIPTKIPMDALLSTELQPDKTYEPDKKNGDKKGE